MKRTMLMGALLAGVTLLGVPGTGLDARSCWYPPVTGTVTDPFREPACTWCAGNRGIEYRVGASVEVRAAASGVVSFVGTVAGTRYVVVRSADGSRVTYGRLRSTGVGMGERVLAGTAIAEASDEFFLGLRIGDRYVDPAPYIGRLAGRPRLVPIDGSPARPSPTLEPRCGTGVGPTTAR
jgi:murein DD-endopeptidase MepM/ murein hydrolase activator NlpD